MAHTLCGTRQHIPWPILARVHARRWAGAVVDLGGGADAARRAAADARSLRAGALLKAANDLFSKANLPAAPGQNSAGRSIR